MREREAHHKLDILVAVPPCDKGCPHRDGCYHERLVCEAFEEYVREGETEKRPESPTHERWLELYKRRDKLHPQRAGKPADATLDLQ